jgi:CRP/FNR family transcriptional regulator, anaerobic regulatory protein
MVKGAAMANAAPDQRPIYFPSPRQELAERLRQGDRILDAAMATEKPIRVGHVLVRGGETQTVIYRVITGKVARIRAIEDGRRQIICIFSPGDLVAVKAMLLDRQPDNVEALSRATVKSLRYTDALKLGDQYSDVNLRFMWQLAEDERRLHNSVMMLGRGTAVERISTVLLDLQARLVQFGNEVSLIPIRQQDLADYVGLTIIHVNRTLRALREQGALETRMGGIIVRDVAALHQHAAPMLDVFQREAPEFGAGVH